MTIVFLLAALICGFAGAIAFNAAQVGMAEPATADFPQWAINIGIGFWILVGIVLFMICLSCLKSAFGL